MIFSSVAVGKVVIYGGGCKLSFNVVVLRALYFYDCEIFWDFHMQHIILLKKEGKS